MSCSCAFVLKTRSVQPEMLKYEAALRPLWNALPVEGRPFQKFCAIDSLPLHGGSRRLAHVNRGPRNQLLQNSFFSRNPARSPLIKHSCFERRQWRIMQRRRIEIKASFGMHSRPVVWALLLACVSVAQVLASRTQWGCRLSAPVLAMAGGTTLASLGILPLSSPAYDLVWSVVVPMAVALSMLESDVRLAFTEAGPTLFAFIVGAIGTIVGTLISFAIVGSALGPEGWKIASCFCASYIGGSINYAATAKALGLSSGSVLSSGIAMDNIAMAGYLTVIMSLKEDPQEKRLMDRRASRGPSVDELAPGRPLSPVSILLSLAVASLTCLGGEAIATYLPLSMQGAGLAITAVLASLAPMLASSMSRRLGESWEEVRVSLVPSTLFRGSEVMGGTLMLLFFAVVGSTAGPREAMAGGVSLFFFIFTLLMVHIIFILGFGKLARLPFRTVMVASNANVGGPATAAAMCNARGWLDMVRPAILTGTLGYSVATSVGCVLGGILQKMV